MINSVPEEPGVFVWRSFRAVLLYPAQTESSAAEPGHYSSHADDVKKKMWTQHWKKSAVLKIFFLNLHM